MMRTLIPIVILVALAYAGWFYLQSFINQPLRESLLLTDTGTLRELTVTNDEQTFRMFRSEAEDWVVKQGAIEIYDQGEAVGRLVEFLGGLRTDSVLHNFRPGDGPAVVLYGPDGTREELRFSFATGWPAMVKVGATGDVFALPGSVGGPLVRMLQFDTYRGGTSLKIAPGEVDSISVRYHDSLRWRVPLAEVPRLAKTLIAPAFPPDGPPAYAEYFDEVMDREKYFATLTLYALADSHRIEVFRDSQWVRPYVLVGEDFPRRYFALDSLR